MTMLTDTTATENSRLRKKLSRSMGWDAKRSHTAKQTRTATPAMPAPMTVGEDQPWTGASMIARAATPARTWRAAHRGRRAGLPPGSWSWGRREGQEKGHGRDGHVDQEDRTPAEVRQEQAPDDRTESDPRTGGRRPEAKRPLPFPGSVYMLVMSARWRA